MDIRDKSLRKEKENNLTRIAYEKLKESIICNKIKPGDCLSEVMIAGALNMSRTPVREATKILANEGLLDIQPGIGVIVKPVSLKDLTELFDLRIVLEGMALETSINKISDQELSEVEEEWMEIKKKVSGGEVVDIYLISQFDAKLHGLIVDRSENSYLIKIMTGIRQNILRYQLLTAQVLRNYEATINQHLEIIGLLKERNLKALRPVLKNHIKAAAEITLGELKKQV